MSHKNNKGIVLPFQKLLLTSFAVSVFIIGLFSVSISNAQELYPNKKSGAGYQLEREIISLSSSLDIIENYVAGSVVLPYHGMGQDLGLWSQNAEQKISDLQNGSIVPSARELWSQRVHNHSTRIKNNFRNFTEPLQNKLTKLSNSKDIIVTAISDKTKRGRVAGVLTENSPNPLLQRGNENASPFSKGGAGRGLCKFVQNRVKKIDTEVP